MNALKVLVVDDSTVQRAHVMNMCTEHDLSDVSGATDGADAIEKLKQDKYQLVFIDLEMPVMDGVELARHIAKDNLAEAVIILSSKDPSLISSIGTMAESDGLNVLGTFQKPLQPQDLKTSLKRVDMKLFKSDGAVEDHRLTKDDILQGMKNEEITLVFQPKVTCKGILLKGVESLARWTHPKLGFISPEEFIHVAEEYGMISELTHYLFDIALKQKAQWLGFGINFHLAFNLSPLMLSDPDLAEKITNQVNTYKVDSKEIVLEVTENAICGEVSMSIQTLAKLRLSGFKIAIDDYGTGFANAQQLSRVPATELKLDRVLVDNAANKPQQLAILRSTVNLAKDLGLNTVAEGVENFDDYQLIHDLGVDLIQGYYFSKPLTPNDLITWLTKELPEKRKAIMDRDKES